MRVSEKFRARIKSSRTRAYEIARQSGLHSTTLSKIMNGVDQVRDDDPRVLRVAHVIGLAPDECFEHGENQTAMTPQRHHAIAKGT